MKTKIISLALAMLMLLSLALVGCEKEETPPPAPVPPATEKLLDNIVLAPDQEQAPIINKVSFKDIDNIEYLDNGLILTAVETLDAEGVNVTSTTYSLTSIYSGKTVALPVVNEIIDDEDPAYKTTVTYVDGNELGDFVEVVVIYGDSEKADIFLYNKNAEKVAEKLGITDLEEAEKLVYYDNNFPTYNGLISFMGDVYLVDEDTQAIEFISKGYGTSIEFDELWYAKEIGYFVYQRSPDAILFLDKTLNVVKTVRFDRNTNAYDDWQLSLDMNTILYVEIIALPEDATEYEFIYEGQKARAQYTKYSLTDNTYTTVSIAGILPVSEGVLAPTQADAADYGYGYYAKGEGELVSFEYYEIKDKNLIEKNNYVVLNSDLTIAKYIEPINGQYEDFEVTQNGMMIIEAPYGEFYINASGQIIGAVKEDSYYNNLWCIVDEKEVYDSANNLIYTIPADYEITNVLSSALLLKTTVEDAEGNETDNTYLWKGVDQLTLICSTPKSPAGLQTISGVLGTTYAGYAIMTMNIATMTGTAVFYDCTGAEVAKYENVTNLEDSFDNYNAESLIFEVTTTAGDGTTSITYEVITFVNPTASMYY